MRLLAPCPVTIIKDSPRPGREREEDATMEEGGKSRANASLIIRSPRLVANGPRRGNREVGKLRGTNDRPAISN